MHFTEDIYWSIHVDVFEFHFNVLLGFCRKLKHFEKKLSSYIFSVFNYPGGSSFYIAVSRWHNKIHFISFLMYTSDQFGNMSHKSTGAELTDVNQPNDHWLYLFMKKYIIVCPWTNYANLFCIYVCNLCFIPKLYDIVILLLYLNLI